MDSVRVTLRLILVVCAVTAVPLDTTNPFVDNYIPPQVSPDSAPEQIFQVQRDETAITSVGQTVDTPVENTSTTAESKPTTGDPKFVITPVNVEPRRDTRKGRSDGDVSEVPATPRDINGLPFNFLNAFPFSFFPSFQFPMTFPFNKNNYNSIGVQSSESVWSTVRPGPNSTVITEIHHQSGDSPTEVAYYVNGTEVKHQAVPALLQELQEYDRNINKGKDPNNPAVSHTYEKEGRTTRIEPSVSNTYEKEGRSRRIESLNDEVDGKNLRNLIRILQTIQMRIDLFRKDVAEILTPIVYNLKPIETLPPPVPHRPHRLEEKPETSPTRTEEKPSETEENPSKTEEKPTKTEEKPVEAKPTSTEEKPTKIDENPTKTEEKPTKTEEKPIEAKPSEEKPTKTNEKPAETPAKTDSKPAEASSEPPKTNPIASINGLRQARSPDRGYGGPYPYGEGLFGRRPYYGGGYYPYGDNHGWVPVYDNGYGDLDD